MLGKLMKHEFRATGRIGLPLCGVMLALSVVAGMVIRFRGGSGGYGWLERAGSTVVLLYGLSIFAAGIGIFIVLMQHYKRNLLGDEGYLMRTLPVSIHELLLSKLFVALLWYLVSSLLTILSAVLVGLLSGEVRLGEFGRFWDMLRRTFAGVDAGTWAQAFLVYLGAAAFLTLIFYADFAMTQSFSKRRVLYNIMFVVVFIVLLRLIFALNGLLGMGSASVGVIAGPDGPTQFHASRGSGVGIAELYFFDVLLYFLTWGFLKYRPNLE